MFQKKRTIRRARKQYGKASISTQINRAIDKRIETKFACNEFAQIDILGTPFFNEISNMGQGATESTRIGVRINPTYMELKIAFNALATTAFTAGGFIRLMVVQTKGDPLTVGDMPTEFGECPDFDQYNVWYDRLVQMRTLGGDITSNDPPGYVWEYSKVLKRMPGVKQTITYDSTAGAAQSGGIYLFAIASDADVDIGDGYGLLKYKDG